MDELNKKIDSHIQKITSFGKAFEEYPDVIKKFVIHAIVMLPNCLSREEFNTFSNSAGIHELRAASRKFKNQNCIREINNYIEGLINIKVLYDLYFEDIAKRVLIEERVKSSINDLKKKNNILETEQDNASDLSAKRSKVATQRLEKSSLLSKRIKLDINP